MSRESLLKRHEASLSSDCFNTKEFDLRSQQLDTFGRHVNSFFRVCSAKMFYSNPKFFKDVSFYSYIKDSTALNRDFISSFNPSLLQQKRQTLGCVTILYHRQQDHNSILNCLRLLLLSNTPTAWLQASLFRWFWHIAVGKVVQGGA